MDEPPLDAYTQFRTSTPARWGEKRNSTITYGSQVIPDLVDGIYAFVEDASTYSKKRWPSSAALGCVPYFTSFEVADALSEVNECCIVVDKQATHKAAPNRAQSTCNSLGSLGLYELTDATIPDEHGRTPGPIVPGEPETESFAIGPIRLAGWQRDPGGRQRPILHAKMLLLGVKVIDEGEFGEEIPRLVPHRTWIGSANWTTAATSHLEFGIWCDDDELMSHNRGFLMDVIQFSEPCDSTSEQPRPEIVQRGWDDDAFRAYVAEFGPFDPDDDY